MRRLGVAIVIQNIDATAGMERQALQLARQLVRRGARVWIISTYQVDGFVPRLPPGVRYVERVGRLTIHRVPLCRDWLWRSCVSLYELTIALILASRAHQLDVMYAVYWSTATSASRIARFLDCPLFVKFAGGGEYGDFATIARDPERRAILARLATVERLVCISPQIAQEARAAGMSEERLVAIPNGIDRQRFEGARPATLPGPDGAEHVLVVGALRREKRLPELVRAFAGIAQARPRAHLVIAGEGPEHSAIRAVAREVGLEQRVHLLGTRKDVPQLLAAARIFVLPSASEGLSNALLEALAAGTPIVATDIEGNRAVVEHEKEALLVPSGDADALGRAIVRLLEDRDLAARLARAGHATVGRYDMDSIASQYERAFREVAHPLPSSLRLIGRYFRAFDTAGITGVAIFTATFYGRKAITGAVLAAKRLLGIERDILGGWPTTVRPDPP
jgi:glycosyltransferase involved in cell wall biosynthesis